MIGQHTKAETYLVTAMSRPKRVAFLVDLGNALTNVFDAIVRTACHSWAGAYFVVIPIRNEDVLSDDWRELLKAADPDLVVNLASVSDAAMERIESEVCPGKLEEIDVAKATNPPYVVSTHDVQAVGIEGIVPLMAAAKRGPFPRRFLYLHGYASSDDTNALFLSRNFGVLDHIVSNTEAFESVDHLKLDVSKVPAVDVLREFIDKPVAVTAPRDVAAAFAGPRWLPEYESTARAFQLYVGDSPLDSIASWNRMTTAEDWMNRSGVWIPSALARDEAFLEVLGKWIQRNYWSGGEGQGLIRVLSYSVTAGELEPVVLAMRKFAHIPTPPGLKLTDETFLIPKARSWPADSNPHRATAYTAVTAGLAHVSLARPSFVEGPVQAPRSYMVDLELEYHERGPGEDMRLWRVPRRRAVAGLFASGHLARIVWNRRPSMSVTAGDLTLPFKIPTAFEVFYAASARTSLREHSYPTSPYHFAVSPAGTSLSGLVGLFGSLYRAASAFDDEFWRKELLDLADQPDDRLDRQVAKMEQLLSDVDGALGSGWMTDAAKRVAGANLIAKGVHQNEGDGKSVTLAALKSRFNQNRQRRANYTFDEIPKRELEGFVESGVLLYGAKIYCNYCRTGEWRPVDAVAREMRCNGCLNVFTLPLEVEWSYRLNDLAGNAIRRFGIVTVLHLLSKLEFGARAMYAWLPSLDVFDRATGNHLTDLDLVALRDGELHIGEAKSHPRGLKDEVLKKLGDVASQLRPDVVHVAATGTEWPPEVAERIERLHAVLQPEGIQLMRHLFSPTGRVMASAQPPAARE